MAIESATDAQEAWNVIRRNAKQIKLLIAGMKSTLSAGGVTVEYVFDQVYRPILNSMSQLNTLAATTNLNAYVQSVTGNGSYSATTEIAGVTAAQQNALDWINTNAGGLSLTGDTATNYIANGSIASNRFSGAQTSSLRTLLDAITAEINS